MDWNRLFFSADGRIGRQTFWIGFLILLGAGVVVSWIPLLGLIATLALIYPWTCLFAKRFHDMNKSGWLALLPVAAPAILFTVAIVTGVGGIITGAMLEDSVGDASAAPVLAGIASALLFVGLGMLVWLIGTLWAGLSDGDPGPNRYGPPPPPPNVGVSPPSAAPGA